MSKSAYKSPQELLWDAAELSEDFHFANDLPKTDIDPSKPRWTASAERTKDGRVSVKFNNAVFLQLMVEDVPCAESVIDQAREIQKGMAIHILDSKLALDLEAACLWLEMEVDRFLKKLLYTPASPQDFFESMDYARACVAPKPIRPSLKR
jgi:hypothetical protein